MQISKLTSALSQEGISRGHFIPYAPHLKELAKNLRQNMTPGEVILWQYLKKKQMCGYDFDRQRHMDQYIVDFYSGSLQHEVHMGQDWIKVSAFSLYLTGAGTAILQKVNACDRG